MNDADAAELGEFELIARYFHWPSNDASIILGPGDDAALVQPSETLALSTDTLVEGVHFLPDADPGRLGYKVLAVNLSDMAAMGAKPRWFTLALSLPAVVPEWIEAFAGGLHECAEAFGVALVGGDVSAGPRTFTVQIIGEVPKGLALRRSGAAAGDVVFVTGTPGDAAAGLRRAKSGHRGDAANDQDEDWLIARYEMPEPRVAAGIALRGIATAAIDVSDGLLRDLGWICRESGCAAEIDVDQLPVSAALQRCESQESARNLALNGGDDYELCFTASSDAESEVREALAGVDVRVTRIGRCRRGSGVRCLLHGKTLDIQSTGFEHFR